MSEQTKWKPLGDAAGRLDAEKVQQVVTWAKRLLGWWRKLRGVPVRPDGQYQPGYVRCACGRWYVILGGDTWTG